MYISFTVTRPAVCYLWGAFWRQLMWLLILAIPVGILEMGVKLFINLSTVLLSTGSETLGTNYARVMAGFMLIWQILIFPWLVKAFVLSRIFRKGSLGSYNITGTYKGQPVTTIKQAIPYVFWWFIEFIKYTWPSYLVYPVYFLYPHLVFTPENIMLSLALIPLGIYINLLVITDLLRRRTFGPLQLGMVKKIKAAKAPQPTKAKSVKPSTRKTAKK